MSADDVLVCAEPSCTDSIKNHAWGKIKADGWFQQKNGDVWCPLHIPSWVAGWRKKK